MDSTYRPRAGDLVVGHDGHARQSGRVLFHSVCGGWLIDTLGCGRTVLDDVELAPAGHAVYDRA